MLFENEVLSKEQAINLFIASMDIHQVKRELYDLEKDPRCKCNIAYHRDNMDIVKTLLGKLDQCMDMNETKSCPIGADFENVEDKLRSLGYI